MNTTQKNVALVTQWHLLVNNKDKAGMQSVVKENVAIVGPKGQAQGIKAMIEWMDRANITLTPKRYFLSGETILVDQLGEWHTSSEGAINTQQVASVFVIEDGLIKSISRFQNIEQAFQSTGIKPESSIEYQ